MATARTMIVSEDTHTDSQWINALNVFDVSCAINTAAPIENDIVSNHPGGANTLFADGSVHYLSETLDLSILAALVTRNGGEIVGDFELPFTVSISISFPMKELLPCQI